MLCCCYSVITQENAQKKLSGLIDPDPGGPEWKETLPQRAVSQKREGDRERAGDHLEGEGRRRSVTRR